jgi:hypothetical protein
MFIALDVAPCSPFAIFSKPVFLKEQEAFYLVASDD